MSVTRDATPVRFSRDEYAACMRRVVVEARAARLRGVLVTPSIDLVRPTG